MISEITELLSRDSYDNNGKEESGGMNKKNTLLNSTSSEDYMSDSAHSDSVNDRLQSVVGDKQR